MSSTRLAPMLANAYRRYLRVFIVSAISVLNSASPVNETLQIAPQWGSHTGTHSGGGNERYSLSEIEATCGNERSRGRLRRKRRVNKNVGYADAKTALLPIFPTFYRENYRLAKAVHTVVSRGSNRYVRGSTLNVAHLNNHYYFFNYVTSQSRFQHFSY